MPRRSLRSAIGLIGNCGNTGVGWVLAVEKADPGNDQTGEPLDHAAVGPVGVAEHQEGDVGVLPSLHELDLLGDHNLRALRITLDQVGIAGVVQLLGRHRSLQIRQAYRCRGAGI